MSTPAVSPTTEHVPTLTPGTTNEVSNVIEFYPTTPIPQPSPEPYIPDESLPEDIKGMHESIMNFQWKDAKDEAKLQEFLNVVAERYLRYNFREGLSVETLTQPPGMNLIQTPEEWSKSVVTTEDGPNIGKHENNEIFIDLQGAATVSVTERIPAGLSLLMLIDHEINHSHLKPKTDGILANNPKYGNYVRFHGLKAERADGQTDFRTLNEIATETRMKRDLTEIYGFSPDLVNKHQTTFDYNGYGTDLFQEVLEMSDITYEDYRAILDSSDLGTLAWKLGQSEDINWHVHMTDPLQRGMLLLRAFDSHNETILDSLLKIIK